MLPEDKDVLDDLVEIGIEQLDTLDPRSRDVLTRLVFQYLAEHESTSQESIDFMRNFARVASLILAPDRSPHIEAIQRLYQFNREGVERTRSADSNLTENRARNLEARFLVGAGEAAGWIFEEREEHEEIPSAETTTWGKRWFHILTKGALVADRVDPGYAATAYPLASYAGRTMCFYSRDDRGIAQSEKLKLGKTARDVSLMASDVAEKDTRQTAVHLGYASDATACCFYVIVNDSSFSPRHLPAALDWAEQSYELRQRSAHTQVESEPAYAAVSWKFGCDFATNVGKVSRDPSWTLRAIESGGKFLDFFYRNPHLVQSVRGGSQDPSVPQRNVMGDIRDVEGSILFLRRFVPDQAKLQEALPSLVHSRLIVHGPDEMRERTRYRGLGR